MVSVLLTTVVIATFATSVSAIQCYSGLLSPSTKIQCNSTVTYCTKSSAIGITGYGCDDNKQCASQGNTCKTEGALGITANTCCCNTDFCNSATLLNGHILVVIVSVLVALLLLN